VLLVPLNRRIADRDKVRWAGAAHRALVALVGDGAPALLTGAYPEGGRRPVNRVALQVLDPDHLPDDPGAGASTLAVLLPPEAESGDLAAAVDAVGRLTWFRGPGGRIIRVTGPIRSADGHHYWPAPEPGTVRLWRTCPAAVPDTRGEGTGWTFAHAALLSLGFVWRDSTHLPPVRGRGGARYRGLVEVVNGAGAVVVAARPLRTTRVQDHVHRVNPHAVVRPYRALLGLGALGGDHTLQAIGQSRHLGGGLLVPHDLPEGSLVDGALLDTVLGDAGPTGGAGR
jgi:CRISPR-associated protein Csb2